ncbi:MAG: AraC family transcriptional regulator [Opitutaceae bacterium]|nr:AraC family transcriptional regulator [Opitutaceae bacterium]
MADPAPYTIPDTLAQGGFRHHVSKRSFGFPHRHPELELNFVLEGRARYHLQGRIYELQKNTLVWLFPGQRHALMDRSPHLEIMIGLFKQSLVAQFATQSPYVPLRANDPEGVFCRVIPEPACDELRRIYKDQVWSGDDVDAINGALAFALTRSWSVFLASGRDVPGDDVHPAVAALVRCLGNPRRNERIENYARECGLSKSRLTRIFLQQIGQTPSEFREGNRLDRAVQHLNQNPRATLLEAALEGGFASYLQFYRAFRRRYGKGPRGARQRPQQVAFK